MKRGRALIVFATFLIGLAFTRLQAEQLLNMEAKHASCTGRVIQLDGSVTLEHDFGILRALHATIEPQLGMMSQPFVTLEQNVIIDWADGAKLTSQRAEIDLSTLKGHFVGNEAVPLVRYVKVDPLKKSALILVGKALDIALKRVQQTEPDQESARVRLDQLKLEGEVVLEQEQTLQIESDQALYRSLENLAEQSSVPFHKQASCVTFTRQQPEAACLVTTPIGDRLLAKEIKLFLPEQRIESAAVEGSLMMQRTPKGGGTDSQPLALKCQQLSWKVPEGIIALKEQIEIVHADYGTLTCDEQVILHKRRLPEGWRVQTIKSEGTTQLRYQEKTLTPHILTCYGPVTLHHDKLYTTLHSPREANNQVNQARQLVFEDTMGKIYADKAKIEYGLNALKPTLTKIILCGNVRMYNNCHTATQGDVQQYALADLVEFYPDTALMRFSSLEPTHRVLFFDRLNSIQMSAPRLTLTRGAKAGKETIYGEGDVRFLFKEQELDLFRRRFQNLPKTPNPALTDDRR